MNRFLPKPARAARAAMSLLVLLSLFCPAVPAQEVVAQIVHVGSPQRIVVVGEVLAEPMQVRVQTTAGAPLAGVTVHFAVNQLVCILPPPGGPPCPPPEGTYGRFATTGGVLTDADGIATAPTFTAGTLESAYTIYTSVPSQVVSEQTIRAQSAIGPQFAIRQLQSGQSVAVPALRGWAAMLLLAAFFVLAARHMATFVRMPARG